ncbi:E3 ubiquitin-protein ligase synoviolin, partial [Lecanoromycetidae sp. Uapishka_2]
MRFAAYTGTSMVLATGVIIRALHERANFYSACVLFYGQLRPIEVEQLYEKAWFAITETCLAMTIFREEVGGWFLVMFVCLLIGKIWGWIGEGRVEILEQQPPSNPRFFHARLSVSLIISTLFNMTMLRYSINTVLRHARPNMMVMFAFEFAVLTVTSLSTVARYAISLHEGRVIKHQIQGRRAQMRREREAERTQTAPEQATSQESAASDAAAQDDIDSLDVDVPGWEEKGRWVFYLDLTTDFFKLVLYLTFFFVLCMFYGMPIHIIRDVALTIRSFYKRITDFVRYRQATRDMNERYPDATVDEIAHEDVCIICREDMKPWQQQQRQTNTSGAQQPENTGAALAAPSTVDERLRPKKLPCGHILHFACLRSWLERQQNCPTCRRPVLATGAVARVQDQNMGDQPGRAHPQQNQAPNQVPHGNLHQPPVAQNVFNLGPIRIAFGARQGLPGLPQQNNNNPNLPNQQGPLAAGAQLPRIGNAFGFQRQAQGAQTRTTANFSPTNVQLQLAQIEQQLIREINGLRAQQNQLYLVRALQGELARLRIAQANPDAVVTGAAPLASQPRPVDTTPQIAQAGTTFGANAQQQSLGSGHSNLPPGMVLPPGWTILPLQKLPDGSSASSSGSPSTTPIAVPMNGVAIGSTLTNSSASNHSDHAHTVAASLSGSSSNNPRSTLQEPNASVSLPLQSFTSIPNMNGHSAPEGQAQPPDGQAGSSAVQPQPEIPQWGSALGSVQANGGRADGEASGKSQSNRTLNGEASHDNGDVQADSFAESSQIKGKGRAPTVEESHDDVD